MPAELMEQNELELCLFIAVFLQRLSHFQGQLVLLVH